MTLVAVSPAEIHAIATQLRSGMIHADILAKQLDELVAHARPAVDRDVAEQLYRALRTNGAHTCGVHRVARCSMCDGVKLGDEIFKGVK